MLGLSECKAFKMWIKAYIGWRIWLMLKSDQWLSMVRGSCELDITSHEACRVKWDDNQSSREISRKRKSVDTCMT